MPTIALLEPQIPQNTGTIARLCAVTGADLHLVGKLGFELSDKYLKRAGLDYWSELKIQIYSDTAEYLSTLNLDDAFLFSTKAKRRYTDVQYCMRSVLIFGNETHGTAAWIMQKFIERKHSLRIPQLENQRCLNLAVSAGIGLYELLRQCNFSKLQ